MNEQYVTYGVAKLLKEKGFDWYTYHYYDEIGRTWFEDILCDWNHRTTPEVSCPTQQMACSWLRDKQIDILPDCSLVDRKYSFHIINRYKTGGEIIHSDDMYDKYEDAIEAALQYCLTNLI